jgi:hypothetical protein
VDPIGHTTSKRIPSYGGKLGPVKII